MEKKKFESPELILITFGNEDIITESGFDDWGDGEKPGSEWNF